VTSSVAICIWALATIGLAPLPLRYQKPLGLGLLLVLPVILIWLGRDHGTLPVVLSLCAAVSLFRKPLFALFLGVQRWITRT
jgi:hypothetical protein